MNVTGVAALALLVATSSAAATDSPTRIFNRRITPGQTLAHALHDLALPDAQVQAVVDALDGVFDFRRVRPNDQLRLVMRDGELDFFGYRHNATEEWMVRRDKDRYVGSKRALELEKRVVTVELDIQSSVYESAIAAGESPDLPLALADVFAWDIDFYQDVRKGDRAKIVVEKFLCRDRYVKYGEVLAAEYDGEAVGLKRVFRYASEETGKVSYYQEDGSSARKTFLKSPLKYAHITSRFGRRFHPVLKYVKSHNGVDYGAAIGTPVWAVADGTVTLAGRYGANGNLVCLRHINRFETCYAHLSRIAVRRGQRVYQKQVVAYSGNTGRSTGPHLHYALKRAGRYLNPLNQQFPRADPVPRDELAAFAEQIAPLQTYLGATSVASAAQLTP